MNKIIYHLLKFGLFGMMIGTLVYFVQIIFINDYEMLNQSFAIKYLGVCFIIGLISEIFSLESIPFWMQFGIHFILTGLAVWLFNLLIHAFKLFSLQDNISFIFQFIIIYFFVWVGIYFVDYNRTREINSQIAKRKRIKKR